MSNNKENIHFEADESWTDLGNLKTFLSNYGQCKYEIQNFNRINILLFIESEYGLKIQILCSKNLSNILREENGFPKKFDQYLIYKIKKSNGKYIIRLTSEMNICYNDKLTEEQNQNKIRNLKGNVTLQVKVKEKDINKTPVERKAVFDWSKIMAYD